jgi:hypothetical protein
VEIPPQAFEIYRAVRGTAAAVAGLSDPTVSLMWSMPGIRFRFDPSSPLNPNEDERADAILIVLGEHNNVPFGIRSPWGLWRCYGSSAIGILTMHRLLSIRELGVAEAARWPDRRQMLGVQSVSGWPVPDLSRLRHEPIWATEEARRESWTHLAARYDAGTPKA